MPHPRPRVVISRCIEFDHCRYDGAMIPSELVLRLMPYVEFLPVCMEADMGLGVPRDPVRIVRLEGRDHLVQPASGRDVTELALGFAHEHLSRLQDVDGFLLKSRSPSCGIKDVRIYPSEGAKAAITSRASGMFAREVLRGFPHLPVEDEARLLDPSLADHFLIRIFTGARFRQAREGGGARDLMDFHTAHKLLFMGYAQEGMRRLGRIAASSDPVKERFRSYEEGLHAALLRPPRRRSWNNVLMHAMGYFSERLQASEKEHFLQSLQWFAKGKVPLTAPLLLLRSWSLRYGEGYLEGQVLFEPYPVEFMGYLGQESLSGRDLWKGSR